MHGRKHAPAIRIARAVLSLVALVVLIGLLCVPGAPSVRAADDVKCADVPTDCVSVSTSLSGNGYGRLSDTLASHLLDCDYANDTKVGECTALYYLTTTTRTVSFTAAPGTGTAITGQGCSAVVGSCNFALTLTKGTRGTKITLAYSLIDPVTLTVDKSGSGAGTVTSGDHTINCGSDCTDQYARNSGVTLIATPASGSTFTGWSGVSGGGVTCTGTASPCSLSLPGNTTITATFAANVTMPPATTPPPSSTPSPTPHATATPSVPPATPRPTPRPTPSPTPGASSVTHPTTTPVASARPGQSTATPTPPPSMTPVPPISTAPGASDVPSAGTSAPSEGAVGPAAATPGPSGAPAAVVRQDSDATPWILSLVLGMLLLVVLAFVGGSWWTRRGTRAARG